MKDMIGGVIDFALYENGSDYLGIAKVTMPDIAHKTFTVTGAGVSVDIDMPIIGSYNAMKATIDFIDNAESMYKLAETRKHIIDCRAAHQALDKTSNALKVIPYKHVLEIIPISTSGGDIQPANAQSTTGEFSVLSLKTYIDGKLVRHIDALRGIDIGPDGVNRFAEVNNALGK